jgi:hypothetical protein
MCVQRTEKCGREDGDKSGVVMGLSLGGGSAGVRGNEWMR